MPFQLMKHNQDGTNLQEWVCCAFPSSSLNTQKETREDYTIKKGETRKANNNNKKRQRGKEREKHEPWNSFIYCLVLVDPYIATQWTVQLLGFSVHDSAEQEYWSWLQFLFQWIFLVEIQPRLLHWQAKSLPLPYLGSLIHERKKKKNGTSSSEQSQELHLAGQ